MLSTDILVNLATVMLILNGLNIRLSHVVAASSSNTSKGLPDTVLATSRDGIGLPLDIMDFLNIRHERSKQRRHANNDQVPHLARIFHEARGNKKTLHLPYDIDNSKRPIAGNDEKRNHKLNKSSRNIHSTAFDTINIDVGTASGISVLGNAKSNLNNANGGKNNSNDKLVETNADNLEATAATKHYLISTVPSSTAKVKAVTHRIRKLHKKEIVESLRQRNIEKMNANAGGQLINNHHRSLLQAEQLLHQQAEMQQTTEMPQQKGIRIHHTTTHQASTNARNSSTSNIKSGSSSSNSNSYRVAQESNSNEGDVLENDIDINEDVSAADLIDETDKDDTQPDDSGDTDTSDDFYLNDDNNLNESFDSSVKVADILFATTLESLATDRFAKEIKNLSSDFSRDIDNNVDLDDNDKANETTPNNWQRMGNKNLAAVNFTDDVKLSSPLSSIHLLYNITNSTEFLNGQPLNTADHFAEPSLSASSNLDVANTATPFTTFYKKEDNNFNDSFDLTENDVSSSKDLIIDETITDDEGLSANELDEWEFDAESETEGTSEVSSDDDTNHFLEGVVDAANSAEVYDWDEISRSNRRDLMHGRDVVTKFLQIVETQHSLGSNCEAGTSLNLGEGVVDRYAQDRFRVEAEVAVNRANMLTRIFKMTSAAAQADVNLLHASVLSMVEFDDDIFAAGNCFDWNEHPAQPGLFCPFAYRLPPPNLGAILAKDLAMEYHYLGNTSEWFFQARKNAEKVIARNEQYLKAFHLYSNKTDERIEDDTLAVKYEDGRWSKPYYDCGGGNIWMLTYTVPFFGYENSTYHFKGTSGIDIDLRRVDIDQCPQRHIPGSTKPLNIFAGTDKCKQRTTMCEAIQGLGFRRGSYKCVCRKGYYFPDTTSLHKYFNGSLLEEEYEKLMLGKNSTYNIVNEYECLPCAEGCDSCEDGSPCIAALNWPMRTSILALACVVIGLLPPAAWFTFRYQQVKVVRAASPALLRVIALGAFFIYCTNIVMYPNPNLYTCTSRIWLREIGFSLTYGALMLKTWRISVIFRVRSAKAVKITDAALLKRLGCICGAIGTCLLVRTLVSPPDVVVGRTADDLKAFLCKTDWWDYTFTSMEVVFLAWGVRLCIMVRKAPSEFNESRFISMAIYNEFLLTCFLNVSMLFLQSPANPDLLYIIFFCHTQLTITLLLALIFGSKVYIVLRSGKSHQENIGMGAKSTGAKFNFRPQVRTFANPSSATASTAPAPPSTSAETKLSDQEALEEIRQLSMQLQRIQNMAPPKGIAVMTISSLLDNLKSPASMAIVTSAASQIPAIGLAGNQLTARIQKPETLPLLSLNTEIKKYQQLQVQQKNSVMPPTLTTNNNIEADMKSMSSITIPSPRVTPTALTLLSKGIIATEQRKEKAVNTEIIGNCIAEELLKQQQHQLHKNEHIICQRCYDKCKSQQHYDKCKILGSPQPEGSISFKDIKLDCMCSQSDDLDQLAEPELTKQNVRHLTKRTAATNTPPSTARRRRATAQKSLPQPANDAKVFSSFSLPRNEIHSKISQNPCSPLSSRDQQPLPKQKICDNCKIKLRGKHSLAKTKPAATSGESRKLSRLSSRCNKLIADIETSKGSHTTTAKLIQTQQRKAHDGDDEPQYSTDDIIFYTTTDTSDTEDSDDDDDDDEDDYDDGDDNGDVVGEHGTTDERTANKISDITIILPQSKSETRVPQKLQPHLATIELKCISLSMNNITTSSATSSTSQPPTKEFKNDLIQKANTTPTTQMTTNELQHMPTPETAGPSSISDCHDSNNGKSKRSDKLVLNLNDRSKFTKEVSV